MIAFYSLPHILKEYGQPSSKLINTWNGYYPGGGKPEFNILLLFRDQGILVNYRTERQILVWEALGCPANAHVEATTLVEPMWKDYLPGYKPLEEVTSMTIDEFYQTFQKSTDKCIATPLDNWPTVESGD